MEHSIVDFDWVGILSEKQVGDKLLPTHSTNRLKGANLCLKERKNLRCNAVAMETLMNVENPWTLPAKEILFEFAISSRNMALISKKWFMEAQVFFNVEFCQNH